MEIKHEKIIDICSAFEGIGTVHSIERIPYGHINDTFKISAEGGEFILQRINTNIFTDPDGLIANILAVTSFLRSKIVASGGDPDRETLNLIPVAGGGYMYRDESGCYRMYLFISDATCYNKAEKEGLFGESAKAFGRFQNLLADFDASTLTETIKNFHYTPGRFENFEKALNADALGRKKDCLPEIEFYLARREFCSLITDRLADGRIPLRVTHNDTKLNNVMIDNATLRGICVIDLDTVMPGSSLYDYGDSIRFGASSAAEDEKDLDKVFVVKSLFEEYTKNFLAEAGDKLTSEEKLFLPEGAIMMTLECGMRFLTDYLEGDVYFHTRYEGQNLDRARTQMKLVADMESMLDYMHSYIDSIG